MFVEIDDVVEEPGESRLHFLLRVAAEFCRRNDYQTIRYDGVLCDGECLAAELEDAAAELPERQGDDHA